MPPTQGGGVRASAGMCPLTTAGTPCAGVGGEELRTPLCCLGAAVILHRRVPTSTRRLFMRGSADFMSCLRPAS